MEVSEIKHTMALKNSLLLCPGCLADIIQVSAKVMILIFNLVEYICTVIQDTGGSSKSTVGWEGNVKARKLETTLKSSINDQENFELNTLFHGEPDKILEHRCNMESQVLVRN